MTKDIFILCFVKRRTAPDTVDTSGKKNALNILNFIRDELIKRESYKLNELLKSLLNFLLKDRKREKKTTCNYFRTHL